MRAKSIDDKLTDERAPVIGIALRVALFRGVRRLGALRLYGLF